MSLTTFSVTISKAAGGTLELNDGTTYEIAGDRSFNMGEETVERAEVVSTFLHGAAYTHFRKEQVEETTLVVYVSGTNQSDLKTNIDTVVAEFQQTSFTLTVTMDAAVRTYTGYYADHSVSWRPEYWHALKVPVMFKFPRLPS